MQEIQVSKFKATCLAVLDRVATTGKPLLVTRRGKPLARILPAQAATWGSYLGAMKGTGRIVGDIVAPAAEPSEWDVLR